MSVLTKLFFGTKFKIGDIVYISGHLYEGESFKIVNFRAFGHYDYLLRPQGFRPYINNIWVSESDIVLKDKVDPATLQKPVGLTPYNLQINDYYYVLSEDRTVRMEKFVGVSPYFKNLVGSNSVFNTQSEVAKELKRREVRNQLKYQSNGYKFIPYGDNWFINYDVKTERPFIERTTLKYYPNEIYFSTKEEAEAALETIDLKEARDFYLDPSQSEPKKVFVSLPMNGRCEWEIRQEMKEIEDKLAQEIGKFVIIDSLIEDSPKNAGPLWYLGKSIEMLSDADLAYFADGWRNYRGCQLEHQTCIDYGVKIIHH